MNFEVKIPEKELEFPATIHSLLNFNHEFIQRKSSGRLQTRTNRTVVVSLRFPVWYTETGKSFTTKEK